MFDLDNLPTGEELDAYLAEQDDEALDSIAEALRAAMLDAYSDGNGSSGRGVSADDVETIESRRAELDQVTAAQQTREAERADRDAKASSLMDGVQPGSEPGDGDGDEDDGDDGNSGGAADDEGDDVALDKNGRALVASVSRLIDRVAETVVPSDGAAGRDLNPHIRLGDIAQHTPDAKVPQRSDEPVLVASADMHPFTQGGQLNGYSELATACHRRARAMGVERQGRGASKKMVASLHRNYTYQLGRSPSHDEVQEVLKAASDVENLVAAGGWCPPSEISYDFFTNVAEDGMLELPSVGTAERGGIQMPQSQTFGDVIDSPGLWTWTEQNDLDAVSSDSVIKPCVRVPCPSFTDVRLGCDGFCVTAGNFVEFAYPEAVQHFLRLVMAARAHLTNANIIDFLVNGGTAPDDIGPSLSVDHTGLIGDAAAKLLSSIELSAIDMRTHERMERDAILEAVFPEWVVGPFKAALANRNGVDFLNVTNAMVANWFNTKNIRAQFVQDWQVDLAGEIGGPTPVTAWPSQVDYLMYPPGTFVRANGLSLDLGVIRDSVLNETNDHTAAFVEDCYLVHKPGNRSVVVTVDLCTAGVTGSANLTCAA